MPSYGIDHAIELLKKYIAQNVDVPTEDCSYEINVEAYSSSKAGWQAFIRTSIDSESLFEVVYDKTTDKARVLHYSTQRYNM